MKVSLIYFSCLSLVLAALAISGCAGPGSESFHLGQQLAGTDRMEEAVAMYEDALAKEPGNLEYMDALKRSKGSLAEKHLEKARSALSSHPLTHDRAQAAYQEAEKALSLVPASPQAEDSVRQSKSELERIQKRAEMLYAEASKSMEKNDWSAAVKNLREVRTLYSSYLDTPLKLKGAEEKGVAHYLGEAHRFGQEDEWGKAVYSLTLAQQISPENQEIQAAWQQARGNHSTEYYLARADSFAAKNEWDRAIKRARQAQELAPSEAMAQKVASLRQSAAFCCIDRCRQNFSEKRLYSSYCELVQALQYDPSIKSRPETVDLINRLLAAMSEKASHYESKGRTGNAFVWYEKILNLAPASAQAFTHLQEARDKIRERVVKKIAIMDFSSPSDKADAGRLITDSLLSHITSQTSSDVKILARDVLGVILKEIEMGQTGLYDIESAKKAGKLKGTDIFIFGSVLNFHVEKNTTEGHKLVNVAVGKKSVPNPAYQTWMMMQRGRPTPEESLTAPPATIEEDIRETIRYKVGTEKKRASVGVSFRVIDIEEGELVITKTIRKSHEVKDDFSEGVAFANIPFDPLEIPSDSELMEKVTQDVVAELTREVLSRFQNLQGLYSNAAEMLKRKKAYEMAVEKYTDVIHIEEIKNISGPLTEIARAEIEKLLRTLAN